MDDKRKCQTCQKPINIGAKFCNFCGAKQPVFTARSAELYTKNFLTGSELATLQNELAEQPLAEVIGLFEHSNKYLVQLALQIFLSRATKEEKKTVVKKYLKNPDFLAALLALQPDLEELFSELWSKTSENPWLVQKYFSWAKNKNYKLNPEAARYLEASADTYLQKAFSAKE